MVIAGACALFLYDFGISFEVRAALRHPLTTLFRLAQMACPPLWLAYDVLSTRRHRNVVYCAHDQATLHMDIIAPRAPATRPLPVFLFFHGGGWAMGTRGASAWA